MSTKTVNTQPAIDGFVGADDPLSPRAAFQALNPVARQVVGYTPKSLWERDTARLPRNLQGLRRKAKDFAEKVIEPAALELDLAPQPPLGQIHPLMEHVLTTAGREGFQTDMMPAPIGTGSMWNQPQPVFALAVKVEEFARADGGLMLNLMVPSLGQCPIIFSGDANAIRRFLVPAFKELKAGKLHPFSFAITEPTAGSDVEEGHGAEQYTPGAVARRANGGWLLNGRKRFIGAGDLSKTLCVFAALEGEGMESWTCFIVTPDMPGFKPVRKELKMGMRASGTAELEFNDVFVPDQNVVAGLRKGWALNRATLNVSRIPVAAMGVGFARSAMETALDFACTATLAGKPLINYQEVQLMLADLIAETAAIRSMVWDQARTFIPQQAAASMTKLYCTDRALNVCNTAMDLIGNHSLLHATKVEKAFRDARLPIIFEGTNQINRLAVIEDIQEEVLAKCQP